MESFLGIVGKLGMVLEFLWFFEIFWVDHIWSCPWHAPKVARVFYLLPAPLSAKKLLVVIQNGVHTSHIDQRPTPLDDLNGTSNQKCQKIGQELDSLNQKTLIEPNGNGKLTGWWLSPTPLKNMKVSWDYEIPKWENQNHVPNQKMAMGNLLHNFWPTKFNKQHPNGLRSQTLDP